MAVDDPGLKVSEGFEGPLGRQRLRSRIGRVALGTYRAATRAAAAAERNVGRFVDALPPIPIPAPVRSFATAFASWFMSTHRAWTGAVARTPVWRMLTNTILKRILLSSMVGLVVVMIGLVMVSYDSRWVISTRSDALRVQGQIIAAAIAGDLKLDSRRNIIDPDRPAIDAIQRIPFRDDGFASLELSIRPERVAPILRRLIEPTDTRARVFSRDFTQIVDSAKVLDFGDASEPAEVQKDGRWKDFYTRTLHLLIGQEVMVYREGELATARDYPEVNQAMRGEPQTLLFLNAAGEQIVNVAVPIKKGDTVLGVLLMSTLPGDVDSILAEASKGFWRLVLVALIATLVSAFFLARTVAKPIKQLAEAAERVSTDINARIELQPAGRGSEEVAQMSRALHTMVNSLYKRIENSEKFAADVAHELKNPLTAASSTAQCLAYASDAERPELVAQIEKELHRLNKLITDVSSASRLDAELARQASEPVPIGSVLEGVVDIFRDKSTASHCKVVLDLPADAASPDYIVGGNAGRLAQVITNLVDNAVSFTPDGGTVRVTMARAGGDVEVAVEDEGPGIEESKLDTIFTRFYTYRPTAMTSRGNNSGLGLSISREIVAAHKGRIWAENRLAAPRPGGEPTASAAPVGARFVVRLPARVQPSRGSGAGRD